jgi:hypothetical protein
MQDTELILNHVNPNIHVTGQGEARHRNMRLKFGSCQATTIQLTNCRFRVVT